MSQYTKYLVCYDVPSDKKRKKFSDTLKDLGLIPVQKSVFYGDLKPAEIMALARSAKTMLNPAEDKCFWFPCHLKEAQMWECLGYQDFKDTNPDGHGFL